MYTVYGNTTAVKTQIVKMSILNYFSSDLPNSSGSLSTCIPSSAIAAANREVRQVIDKNNSKRHRRGTYNKYSPKERAEIGKYSAEHGLLAAKRKFSSKLGINISKNTIQGFRVAYLQEISRKRKADEDVLELFPKKRGRPLMLGEKLDRMVQNYILKTREKGGTITTAIVIAGAKGIVKSIDRSLLAEFGGPATLNVSWAKSLLTRMNFTKRRGTTTFKMSVDEFRRIKYDFLKEVIEVVKMEEIPPQLIFNWDQTGLNLIPTSSWTMERKGSKRIEIKGLHDKRQITAVFCGTLVGEFLPMQLIYGGKTNQCHPPYSFPIDWHITHTPNHWSNEDTMLDYINNIIVPYVKGI